jgi:putative hydrolase of the HAD superfamily
LTGSSRNTTENNNTGETSFEAIFFDAGNTLLKARPSVASIYQRTASRYGVSPALEEIEEAFRKEWRDSKNEGGLIGEGAVIDEHVEKKWWKEFVRRVFDRFEPIGDFDRFFDDLYDTFARPESWELFPEVNEALEELRRRGYRLGLISNWDSRLCGILRGLSLDAYFSSIVISSQVGVEKPDRRIFLLAARSLSVSVEKAIYVGDDPLLDYRGAQGAGMFPFLLDRKGDGHEGMRTIGDLRDLLPYLKARPVEKFPA